MSAVHQAVAEAIAERGMSQQALADALHRSQAWVSRRVTGHVPFTTDDLVQIAGLLDVPVRVLFGDSE